MSRFFIPLIILSFTGIIFVGCSGNDPISPDPTTGTIVIDCSPDTLEIIWTLTVDEKMMIEGSGDSTLTEMAPGDYSLSWGEVENWVSPEEEKQVLTAGSEITFIGTYTERPLVDMVLIPAGAFTMGSPSGELGRNGDEIQHQVTLNNSYYMGVTEVTNGQYTELAQWAYEQGYVTANSTSLLDALDGSTEELLDLDDYDCEIDFSDGFFSTSFPDHPVIEVTWFGAVAFCDWLSLKEGRTREYDHATWTVNGGDVYGATGYRLPTEAEWEYACRAGTSTRYYLGNSEEDLNSAGWYAGNSGGITHPYGQKQVNNWGLSDMHGNVWDWCWDWYDSYPGYPIVDPEGPVSGSYRVIRGGSVNYGGNYCRSAFRSLFAPGAICLYDSGYFIGFRIARSAK